MLLECRYSYFPPLKNVNKTWNHLIFVTNERIKRKVRCRMTKGSTLSWGSVSRSSLLHRTIYNFHRARIFTRSPMTPYGLHQNCVKYCTPYILVLWLSDPVKPGLFYNHCCDLLTYSLTHDILPKSLKCYSSLTVRFKKLKLLQNVTTN